MIPPPITAEEVAERAYQSTPNISDPEARLLAMLKYVDSGRDDQDAELIAACRKKAGL